MSTDFFLARQQQQEEQERLLAERKQQLADLNREVEAVKATVRQLPADDRRGFAKYLRTLAAEIEGEATDAAGKDELPGPNEAVIALLEQHPDGLPMRAIEDELEGRFLTSSPQWRNMLQAAAVKLRKRGVLSRDEDGRYRLLVNTDTEGESGTLPAHHRIIQALHEFGQPASQREIVQRTGLPEGSVASALYTRASGYFLKTAKNNIRLWGINPAKIPELVREGVLPSSAATMPEPEETEGKPNTRAKKPQRRSKSTFPGAGGVFG